LYWRLNPSIMPLSDSTELLCHCFPGQAWQITYLQQDRRAVYMKTHTKVSLESLTKLIQTRPTWESIYYKSLSLIAW
jgi:hypothetical protein